MSYQILTTSNYKTDKGNPYGYRTATINLSPYTESGVNMCPNAKVCQDVCLVSAGRNNGGHAKLARLRRTKFLLENRAGFLGVLEWELKQFINYCRKKSMIPTIRPNALSDQAWLGLWVAEKFPDVQVYDYTKLGKPWERVRKNYNLIFSYDGTKQNRVIANECLNRGVNVAVVFRDKLPRRFLGVKVINGDETDLRFLEPQGAVVGLKAKGRAKRDTGGFVVDV